MELFVPVALYKGLDKFSVAIPDLVGLTLNDVYIEMLKELLDEVSFKDLIKKTYIIEFKLQYMLVVGA